MPMLVSVRYTISVDLSFNGNLYSLKKSIIRNTLIKLGTKL